MESANRPSIKIDSVVRTERRQAQRDNPTRRWWLVLPVVLVSMTTASTDPILLNNLIISRYQVVYGLINASSPASESACKAAAQTPNDSDLVDLSIKVQQSVSHLNIVMAGVGALPAVLSYVILGANCDRIGRRPLLIIPCVGRIIRFTILLLLVRFDLGDAWLIVANAIDGLFGSNSLLILGAIAYISDCTTSTQRARAMLLEEVSAALTRIFPLLGLGFWLQEHGYTLPIAINLGINVAALIYVCLVQPESCGANSRNPLQWLARLKEIRFSPIRAAYRVFLVRRRGHDQRTIILLTLIQILLFIVLFGFVSIHPLYLYGKPLCFNVLDLAILTSAQFTLMILISLALSFLQKYPAVNSMFVPLIGIATYAVHLILFGVAQKVWLVYVGRRSDRRL